MKILGVDLGTYSIKVAELDAGSKNFVLSNFFEMPLSADPNRDRQLEIIEALRSLAANYDPTQTRWVFCVPQHLVSVHYKRFPFKERPKISKSLAFEIEDDIPLDIDDAIFDYKIVETIGNSADVLTVAAPRDAVKEALAIAKDGGFEPEIVSVEAIALANVFEAWNQPPPEVDPSARHANNAEGASSVVDVQPAQSRLILHMGHSRSLLLVYREGALVATRSILWGGLEIAENVARAFSVPLFEAVKIVNTRSFILMNSAGATADQLKLSEAVSSQVDNLLRDLKLVLLEVKSAFNLSLDQIELTGGISQVQNIGAYITQGLEIPANVNHSALSTQPSRLQLSPPLEAVALVAVGLAIEGLKRPRNPAINLRKEEFARENVALQLLVEKWKLPAQILTSVYFVFCFYSCARDQIASSVLMPNADAKLVEAATKAGGLQVTTDNVESSVSKYLTTQKKKISNYESLSKLDDYIPAMDLLAKFSEKAPAKAPLGRGFDISSFEIENDDVTIKGKAQGPDQIQLLEKTLNGYARGGAVTKIPPVDALGTGTAFGYKFKINRKL